jgi:hypothetical protein
MISLSSIRIGHIQRKILKELHAQAEQRRLGWLGRRSLLYVLDVHNSADSCSFSRAINLLIKEELIKEGTFYEYYMDCLDREPTEADHEYALEIAYENRSEECYYRITHRGMKKFDSLPPEKSKPPQIKGRPRPGRRAKKIILFPPR